MATDYTDRVIGEATGHVSGIDRVGLMFGNPISSYDMNAMQGILLDKIACYASNSKESSASVDLEEWKYMQTPAGTTVLDTVSRRTRIHNVRATIDLAEASASTSNFYFIYCPFVELQESPTVWQNDQYLRIYYRKVYYVWDATQTRLVGSSPVSDKIYRYGYRKSPSTVTPEATVSNNIKSSNHMDAEVSVRVGLEWTLSYDSDEKLPGFTQGPIVALYRKGTNKYYCYLFNTRRDLAYNNNLHGIPTLSALPTRYSSSDISIDILLDGAYDMLMDPDDSSVFMAYVVFAQRVLRSAQRFFVGVKDAPSVTWEYRLIDGSVVGTNSKWQAGIYWEPNVPYLFKFSGGVATYVDPSVEVPRRLRHYLYDSDGLIDKTRTKTFDAAFRYDSSAKKFKCIPNRVYTLDGVDHYYDGSAWKTCIPAGTTVMFPHDNSSHGTPKGTVCCNGQNLAKSDYPELFAVLGTIWGGSDTRFQVPNYGNRVLRGKTGKGIDSTASAYGGSDSLKLTKDYIPEMSANVKYSGDVTTKTINTTEYTGSGSVATTCTWGSGSLKCKISNWDIVGMLPRHYHLSGVANDSGAGGEHHNPVIAAASAELRGGMNDFFPDLNGRKDRSSWPNIGLYGLYGSASIGSEDKSPSWMGVTSLEIFQGGSKADWEFPIVGEPNISARSTSVDLKHKHQVTIPSGSVTVGTARETQQSIDKRPSFAYVATRMYHGHSVVVEDDMVIETIPTTASNIYSAPTVSAELYARTAGNT